MSEDVAAERRDSREQAEFREYCRRWITENMPDPPPGRLPQNAYEVMREEHRVYLAAWQRKCYEAGLVGCDVPKQYGGGGHEGFQRVATSELTAADAPHLLNVIGLGMAAPTILHHGTEEQKQRFIGPILAGDEIWCQGFSEPEAGSDLANVQATAVRDGDSWVINGHKVWTSLAHFASWMIFLARTDRENKYGGITYFIVPVQGAEGVTVKPLVKMTGESGFNEVFFEDLRVGDDLRVDEVGKGWAVAMTTLDFERGAGEDAGRSGGSKAQLEVERLVHLARTMKRNGRAAWDDPVIRDEIVALVIRERALRETSRRAGVKLLADGPVRLPLQKKVVLTEIVQEAARLALEIEGPHAGLFVGDENAPAEGRWPLAYMNSYTGTIAGGSNEIQRNLIGERVLGLPKSR